MKNEPSGDYYDYTRTMRPERPWLVPWHQKYVYRIMHATRNGEGELDELYLTFEQGLEVIKRVFHLTCGVPQIVLLTGWQFEGHDSKYPSWAEVNRHLKRERDATALDSLRWLIREARKYNCLATLHINMFDAYADSPLFQEYVEKDIIAKDLDGSPIIGNVWSDMDCYHVSYTQEWKHGLAQKRIDDLIAMVPEMQENHCLYLDAFLGARKADQQGPISPYLGYSKTEEARTQRKIFRYWRDRDIDVASEYVNGIRADRFVGLQPHTAAQVDEIEDLPDELYCSNPAHFGFTSVTEPDDFLERFCLEFIPWFYKNNPNGNGEFRTMSSGTDICMPALWCEEPTLIAYSKEGYDNKTWRLPPDWQAVDKVCITEAASKDSKTTIPVVDGVIKLSVGANEALRIRKVALSIIF
ncbi:MAG: hypothetical protein HN368_09045 [Spirochaetales bacterium]|jgi:hypothetical protein|nr:hypothetical protein [Spirochaetales bacterium]